MCVCVCVYPRISLIEKHSKKINKALVFPLLSLCGYDYSVAHFEIALHEY